MENTQNPTDKTKGTAAPSKVAPPVPTGSDASPAGFRLESLPASNVARPANEVRPLPVDFNYGTTYAKPAMKVSEFPLENIEIMKARNQMNRAAGLPDRFEIDEVADSVLFRHEFSSRDLNQDSLDGAQASSTSEVGSADEFSEKDEGNTGDVPDHIVHESRVAKDPKENGDSAQDANGAEEEDGEADDDFTGVEGVVGEKRKSIAEVEASLSPKKARIEGTEEVTAAAINSNSVEAVVV